MDEAHFECHDILMLGKSPIKWRQCPDMTTAVDMDIKHQLKQTNHLTEITTLKELLEIISRKFHNLTNEP